MVASYSTFESRRTNARPGSKPAVLLPLDEMLLEEDLLDELFDEEMFGEPFDEELLELLEPTPPLQADKAATAGAIISQKKTLGLTLKIDASMNFSYLNSALGRFLGWSEISFKCRRAEFFMR